MATKTATKTNRNAKAASKATTSKATEKNATVAKPAAKESKPSDKKMSQIELDREFLMNRRVQAIDLCTQSLKAILNFLGRISQRHLFESKRCIV